VSVFASCALFVACLACALKGDPTASVRPLVALAATADVHAQPIVDDVNALPNVYKTVTVEETANKKEIKAVLESGGSIIGCRIVTNHNLQIR
jgi:hypothetical protein